MKFRPCIDLHHGQVKQIVGSTLRDDDDTKTTSAHQPSPQQQATTTTTNSTNNNNNDNTTKTNFATDRPAADFARMYRRDGLTGGHVIMLGPGNEEAAASALRAYPDGGLQVGGGIHDGNAQQWLDRGASHVIVTSFVFSSNDGGSIDMERLERLVRAVGGKQYLVLDLSCRRKTEDGPYFVVTNRWQTYTEYPVTAETLATLAQYCDEFLVHGVDVEGKQCGVLEDLIALLGEASPIPVTYAGGVRSLQDMEVVKRVGKGRVDVTVGSALDCFGGTLKYEDVVAWHNREQQQQQQQQEEEST